MELAIFENDTGEGVVSFRYDGWYTALLIGGERVFGFGNPCGTCGIVFSRLGSVAHRVSDATAVQLLGNLEAIPTPDALRRLARVLEPGEYYPNIVAGTVKLTAPGSSGDYFTTDVVRLFGLRDPDEDELEPTPYYRLGVDRSLVRTGRLHSPHKALVTAIVMPLQDPAQLNRERIEYWKRQYHEGATLTAFAVSILDNQAPSTYLPDPTYPYEEQFLLTLCLLDGHHRIQAAAELGRQYGYSRFSPWTIRDSTATKMFRLCFLAMRRSRTPTPLPHGKRDFLVPPLLAERGLGGEGRATPPPPALCGGRYGCAPRGGC